MIFEWDENKHQQNIKKHGLSFELAPLAFNETMMFVEDTRMDYGEKRYTGFSLIQGRCANTVFTYRQKTILGLTH